MATDAAMGIPRLRADATREAMPGPKFSASNGYGPFFLVLEENGTCRWRRRARWDAVAW